MRALSMVLTAIFILLGSVSVVAQSESSASRPFVVIAHRGVSTDSVTRDFLGDAFLKRATRWPDGTRLQPVDLDPRSAVRSRFSHRVLKRDVAAVRAYWQRIIFSGRGVPPVVLGSEAAVVRYVATHRGAIGYVASGTDTTGTKVITVR